MKKTTTTTMAVLLVASLAMAQGKPAAKADEKKAPAAAATATTGDDPVIVAAGDVSIRKSEFEGALKTLPPEYQGYAQGPGKKQFAEDFLRMKMLAAEGMKAGLDKDPEVQAQLRLMRENLVANAQINRMEKSIAVTDEDLKKVYEANKNTYEQVKARHILIAFKGSPAAQAGKTELTEEQAKAKAEEIRNRIVAGGNFDELAQKESDDVGSGSRGGDLGSFGRGQMVPEFETAAFAAKSGEVTPVVRTQYGYHVIKVEQHDFTPFEEAKPAIERKERQDRLQAQLEALKTNAKPTFNDTYFPPTPPPAPPTEAQPAGETKKQ